MAMRFSVLGPFHVIRDGTPVAVPAAKQRIALATLLLRAGKHVSMDELAARMWDGHEIPDGARGAIQTHIARLRRTLHGPGDVPGLIHTWEEGYVLRLGREDDLDVATFLDLVRQAQQADQRGDEVTEITLLGRALALWRGPALVDVPSELLRQEHVPVLEEQYVGVLERWLELGLRAGRHEELVPELRAATAAHPLRERLWAQLLLALHRSGRRTEALQGYITVSELLRDELGVNPGEDLQRLHRDILSGEPLDGAAGTPQRARAAPAPPVRPRQLPADLAHFTGRQAHLALLDELLSAPGERASRPVVIDGTGGVGKTTLAVHWAHRVQDGFPDGQLYVNLRGFGPGEPLEPGAAIAMVLRALDLPAERLPSELDARAALLRSELAGRRMLLLLDNARDERQVRPLLPGSRSVALITSRNQLRGLTAREGALRVTLDVFSPDETHALLLSLLDAERLRTDPQAEKELGELCAGLPLALSIAAANLDADPHLSVSALVTELREGNRLAALEAGDDGTAAVRAAFDLSCNALPEPERRLFCLLGLLPGLDFTTAAAAAVAGCSVTEARRGLDRLAAAHLIRAHAPGRYTFHDLLRLYAAERVRATESPEGLREAERRMHEWHLHSALAAVQSLYHDWIRLAPPPLSTTVLPATFDGEEPAAAWLEAEHANLVALIHHLAEHGPGEVACLLTDALRAHFWTTRRLDDWLSCARASLTAADQGEDRPVRAMLELSLGNALTFQDRHEQAITRYARALAHAEAAEATDTQAFTWQKLQWTIQGALANTHYRLGQPRQAAEHLEKALALSRQDGDRHGERAALNNLGLIHHELGRLGPALDHLTQALELAPPGSRLASYNIVNMGEVYHSLGRLDEAARHLGTALSLSTQHGDRGVELECMVALAAVHRDHGRHAEALDLGTRALTRTHEVGDQLLRARALNVLGTVLNDLGRHREALDHHRQALDMARQGGNRSAEVSGLIGLSDAARGLGRLTDAAGHAGRALAIARDRAFLTLEGRALTALAQAELARASSFEAAARAKESLRVHRTTGDRLGEARALRVLGDASYQAEGPAAARPHWREAASLFAAIGSPEAAEAAARITGARP